MKALFIGGTGTISTAITKRIAQTEGWELFLINRGNRNNILPENVKTITVDINDEEEVKKRAVPDFVSTTRFDLGATV